MAYGIKYKFRFNSIHGVQYTVNLLKDGFSGSYTLRPLGKAPVIRMKENDPFRATSCDLVLECQTDGEFASLYTSDPFEYRVDVYRGGSMDIGGTLIWSGFIATEIYSEPHIAPPYDVSVTATDGLGILKESTFVAAGKKALGDHMRTLLEDTGFNYAIDWVSTLRQSSGTVPDFIDEVAINLDYMVGKSHYDVLKTILESINATITQYNGRWLIIRETDLSVSSSGAISCYRMPTRTGSTTATSITGGRKSVGKMGVADMWPVGHMTRRIVPAKRRVTVEAPFNPKNAGAYVQQNGWTRENNYATFVNAGGGNSYYSLAGGGQSGYGIISMQLDCYRFVKGISVKIRAASSVGGSCPIGVVALYNPSSGTMQYYGMPNIGWTTTAPTFNTIAFSSVNTDTSFTADAQEVSFNIPANGSTVSGTLTIYIHGLNVMVFDVKVYPILISGYRDTVVIDNGARGDGDTVSITGCRMTSSEYDFPDFYRGLWMESDSSDVAVFTFTDNNYGAKDFLSIQTLGRAQCVALPRIETSGVLDFPSGMTLPPIVILDNSTNSLVKSYDWDLYNEELSFTAISLPASSLTVESETVVSSGSGNSESGWSGSGGGGGSSVSIADATTSGTEIVKLTINGTTTSIKNGVAWGSYDSGKNSVMLNIAGTYRELQQYGYDTALSSTSQNAVQNKVIYAAIGDIETLLAAL